MSFTKYIQSDYYRYSGEKHASLFKLTMKAIFGGVPAFRYCYWFRLAKYGNPIIKPLAIFMHRHYTIKYHIDIKRHSQIGYGLYLSHGMCIVINGRTVIGNNVNISQFVNIGSNSATEHATIGDNVYIGPLVSVVGNVSIGNNATIGSGAVVTKDIPENATAAGVPARVINYDNPAQFIVNPFQMP